MRAILPLIGLLTIVAVCAALGNWQLNRAEYKRGLQATRDQANRLAPLNADSVAADPAQSDGRRIQAAGHWLDDKTVFLDNRTQNGRPGFHVISPLQLADSKRVVLVLRGWVGANLRNRTQVPKVDSSNGRVEIIGFGQIELVQSMQLAREDAPGPQQKIWQYFDYAKFDRWSGMSVTKMIIRQTSATDDQLVRDWPVAGNGVDRHLGYAFQWFSMAVAALIFLLWQGFKWARRAPDTG